MWKEFKDFAMRGSVVDLAVGIVIGAAFSSIVQSLVNDIIMPVVGLIVGNMDFSNIFINLSGIAYPNLAAAKEAGAATINIGLFVNQVVNFLIVAFALFIVIKQINRLRRPATVAPTTKECPFCAQTIPIKARRCPECTSNLESEAAAGAAP